MLVVDLNPREVHYDAILRELHGRADGRFSGIADERLLAGCSDPGVQQYSFSTVYTAAAFRISV